METPSSCPRCGHPEVTGPSCPGCGVIFAKLRARPTTPLEEPATATPEDGERSVLGRWLVGLAAVALVAVGGPWWLRHRRPEPPPAQTTVGAPAGPTTRTGTAAASTDLPPPTFASVPAPPPSLAATSAAVPDEDRTRAEQLGALLQMRATIEASHLQAGEELLARHAEEPVLRSLLGSLLVARGLQEQERHRLPEAVALLQRATTLQPDRIATWLALVGVNFETSDWAAAEAAARRALQIEPRNNQALQGLAYALFRQDRNREAMEMAQAAVEVGDGPNAVGLLSRIRKAMSDEHGMTEQHLSHFNVRYDGEAHEDVGREILRALERHYATLSVTLDGQPRSTIAVILFSREAYFTASGAPAWSGGAFDLTDGRIRIPIGGLTAGLTPEMDRTLIHELTHAFVFDRSRGIAPRQIQEGLAQYMEGKRLGSELTEAQIGALADGQMPGVYGFYLGSLSLVEHLIASRGQGGMNDVIKAMGETGDVDAAFQQVYGQSWRGVTQAWLQRFRQQHGS
jgi:tetratricopeptide (TPR) repeat protein